MDIKQQITSLLKQAEIYRSQGLLVEAKSKYKEAISTIDKIDQIKNKQNLIDGISKKLKILDKELADFVKAPESVEVPKEVQDLIKKQFAFAHDDEDTAALEGAIALAKFGQHERALQDLTELLEKESVRVSAAKNILRCHIANLAIDQAVSQYEEWFAGDLLTPAQLNNVRKFLEDVLQKKGIDQELSVKAEEPSSGTLDGLVAVSEPEEEEEEIIDISSVTIQFDEGPHAGQSIEFDVNFQSGNVISILFQRTEKKMIESFSPGLKFSNMQLLSPIAFFTGTGVVTEKTEISSGPRKGDYSVDIKIESTN